MIKWGARHLLWLHPACEAFRELKQRFTTAPILHYPDSSLPFIVETDASNVGIGAVLSQRQGSPAKMFPCTFYSHKLNSAERNYDVENRELLAMMMAFKEWHHWLEGAKHPFTILTDNRNLECLKTAKRLNPRQARWSMFFSRFNFTVSNRLGPKNGKADRLSQQRGRGFVTKSVSAEGPSEGSITGVLIIRCSLYFP